MNLSLLATGKSLIGMKDHSSPYRMRAGNRLPKFESTKNPFAAAKPEPIPGQASAAPAAKPEPVLMETLSLFDAPVQSLVVPVAQEEKEPAQPEYIPIKVMSASAPASAFVPVVISAPAAPVRSPQLANKPAPAQPVVVTKAPAYRAEPANAVPKAKTPTQHAQRNTPAPSRPAVSRSWLKYFNFFGRLGKNARGGSRAPLQGEFPLAEIKVARNDLNDTDLEVITAQPAEKGGVVNSRLQPAAKTAVAAFNRMTSRFMGAGPAQVR